MDNAKNFYKGREKIIEGFKKGIFPLKSDDESRKQQTSKNFNELNEYISKKEAYIDNEIFKNYFNFQKPSVMLKSLYDLNDREKNKKLVNLIESGLKDLENEIKRMTEDEIIIEKPHEIVDIVEKILYFNPLNQKGEDLKNLTPDQMLSRLPIF